MQEPGERFQHVLSSAIDKSGLTLTEIRRRLDTYHHATISLAALSQWRAGKRQPHSTASLSVVEALETVLELPPNALGDLVNVPLRSGRRIGRTNTEHTPVFPKSMDGILAELGLLGRQEFDEVSVRLDSVVDDHVHSVVCQQILRANRPNAQRIGVPAQADVSGNVSRLTPLTGCTVRRMVQRPEDGLAAYEIATLAPVQRGATAVIEYRVDFPRYEPGGESDWLGYAVTGRVAQALLTVRFNGPRMPTAAQAFTTDAAGADLTNTPQAIHDEGLHNIVHDFGPGLVGLRWWWPDPASSKA